MITIAVLAHNSKMFLSACLRSLADSSAALGWGRHDVEWLLLDDCSDAVYEVPSLFAAFRDLVAPRGHETKAIRFTQHRHYAYGVAAALSIARGSQVLFISHDMIVPPSCLRALLAVSRAEGPAILRPTSQHMDWTDALVRSPPLPLRGPADAIAFSNLLYQRFGAASVAYPILIGDAMLIDRRVIDKIGVFDTGFVGFWADIDYGVRALRAGFRTLVATGAWLHHGGGGFRREVPGGEVAEQSTKDRLHAEATLAYQRFRQKWGLELNEDFSQVYAEEIERVALAATEVKAFEPPLLPDPAVWQSV